MLIDKLTGGKPAAGAVPGAGQPLTAHGSKRLLERIVKWALFLLAAVSLLTTVGIVSVLLFEGVRFFTTDFYQEKRSELTTTLLLRPAQPERPARSERMAPPARPMRWRRAASRRYRCGRLPMR